MNKEIISIDEVVKRISDAIHNLDGLSIAVFYKQLFDCEDIIYDSSNLTFTITEFEEEG